MGSTTPSIKNSALPGLAQSLSARRRHGRIVNAVAEYLRKELRVPEIYLELGSPLRRSDVVAVDSAGSGDIHAVEIKVLDAGMLSTKMISELVQKLKLIPAHFKYIVLPVHPAVTSLSNNQSLFSIDGVGRVGILKFVESDFEPPSVSLAVRPERFRVPQAELKKVEKLLARSHPDIYVRV
jgi:hypothetical protein